MIPKWGKEKLQVSYIDADSLFNQIKSLDI